MSRSLPCAKSMYKSVLFFFFIRLASFLKMSFMFGSYSAFFSLTSSVTPLSGAFLPVPQLGFLCTLSLLMRMLIFGFNPFILLVHSLPGFCAAWYFKTKHWSVAVVLPLICMFLFCLHPVGWYAAAYSLFWVIPLIIYYMRHQSLFLHCLSSTFIAHGVGSVFWIYGKPFMSAATWLSLIPLVCVERLVIVLGMMLTYSILNYIQTTLRAFRAKRHAQHA